MQRLFDSELKVMELVWEHQPVSAKQVSVLAAQALGWNKNTTYTVLTKLEGKGFICREDPGFICTAVYSRDQVQRSEVQALVQKLFGGSRQALFSALLQQQALSEDEVHALQDMIEQR